VSLDIFIYPQSSLFSPFLDFYSGIFFSHRDFDAILECREKGKQVYLYTGRGKQSDGPSHFSRALPSAALVLKI
jgi:hypothetical protein